MAVADIVFHPYEILDATEEGDARAETVITMYGLIARRPGEKAASENIVVQLFGFLPWLFLELPPRTASGDEWSPVHATALVNELRASIGNEIAEHALEWNGLLYYFQAAPPAGRRGNFPMLRLWFHSTLELRRFASRVDRISAMDAEAAQAFIDKRTRNPPPKRGRVFSPFFGRMAPRGHEDNVTATRKFMTMIDSKYSAWIRVTPTAVVLPSSPGARFDCLHAIVSVTGANFSARTAGFLRALHPLTQEEADLVPPSLPRVMSIDGEMYSPDPKAMPNPDRHECVTFMASAVTETLGDVDSRHTALIYLSSLEIDTAADAAAYVSTGVRIDEFIAIDSEADFLPALGRLIKRQNPTVITGYNVHSWDYRYFHKRHQIFGRDAADGAAAGAITAGAITAEAITAEAIKDIPWPQEWSRDSAREVTFSSSKWFSSGANFVETAVPTAHGYVLIDVMASVKQLFKLSKFSLDFVAKELLGDQEGKHAVTPRMMFAAYEASMTPGKTEAARAKARDDMTNVAAYCVWDSVLVLMLFTKLNIWPGVVELSSVAGVTVAGTFRGQQSRVHSLIYDVASRDGIVINRRRLPVPKVFSAETGMYTEPVHAAAIIPFEGGAVEKPVSGLHDFVLTFDFASLYPTIIRAYNMCHTRLNVASSPLEDRAFSGPVSRYDAVSGITAADRFTTADTAKMTDPRYSFAAAAATAETVEITVNSAGAAAAERSSDDDDDDDDEKAPRAAAKPAAASGEPQRYAFQFAQGEPGVLPRVVAVLLDARAATREKLKEVKKRIAALEAAAEQTDESRATASMLTLQAETLNARQLAFKVTANSVYGYTVAQKNGMGSLVEVGMSITARGRQMIAEVGRVVREEYHGRVIYGDSVTGDTPIVVRDAATGEVKVIPIALIGAGIRAHPVIDPHGGDGGKQARAIGGALEVLAKPSAGADAVVWVPLISVIAHRVAKPILRVTTASGFIDVTPDHSLINAADGEPIAPAVLAAGESHIDVAGDAAVAAAIAAGKASDAISEAEAFVAGAFFISGGASVNKIRNDVKCTWTINRASRAFLETLAAAAPFPTTVYWIPSSGVFRLSATGDNVAETTRRYRSLFIDANGVKTIPPCIFTAPVATVENFLRGVVFSLGNAVRTPCGNGIELTRPSKAAAATLRILFARTGSRVSVIAHANPASEVVTLRAFGGAADAMRDAAPAVPPAAGAAAAATLVGGVEVIAKGSDVNVEVAGRFLTAFGGGERVVFDLSVGDPSHRFLCAASGISASNTDSCMVQIPDVKTGADLAVWGPRLAARLTSIFPKYIVVEYEKGMRMLAIAKKMYAALTYTPSGGFDAKTLRRGITIARRDNCAAHREMFESVLRAILYSCSMTEAFGMILRGLAAFARAAAAPTSAAPYEIVKGIGELSAYKSKSAQMAVFGAEVAKSGNPTRAGDRLGYVLVTEPSSRPDPGCGVKPDCLGFFMRLSEQWEAAGCTPRLDTLRYITLFSNSLDTMFATAFREQLAGLPPAFKPRSNVEYTFATPARTLVKLIESTNTKRRHARSTTVLSPAEIRARLTEAESAPPSAFEIAARADATVTGRPAPLLARELTARKKAAKSAPVTDAELAVRRRTLAGDMTEEEIAAEAERLAAEFCAPGALERLRGGGAAAAAIKAC